MPQYKILLVDCDGFLRDIYSKKFTMLGVSIETLDKPTKAFVKQVLTINPDLILTDILMPDDIDGFEAVKMLKADSRTNNIPVMFESNLGERKNIEDGIALGAVDYFVKATIALSDLTGACLEYLRDPRLYKPHYLQARVPLPVMERSDNLPH